MMPVTLSRAPADYATAPTTGAAPIDPTRAAPGGDAEELTLELLAIVVEYLKRLNGEADDAYTPALGGMPAGYGIPYSRGVPTGGPAGGTGTPEPVMKRHPGDNERTADDGTTMPGPNDKRPDGDNRSAQQILDDCPLAKNLGNQKDIERDNLKKQIGDWENDPDPQKRADAAYRLTQVLKYIKSSKTADGKDRASQVTDDNKIDGITKDGDARHGTEAGLLKDFAEKGYGALKTDHRLDHTKDQHVRADGTNMDNGQYAAHLVLETGADAIRMVGHWAGKALSKIPGLEEFAPIVEGAANGTSGLLKVGDVALEGGDTHEALIDAGYDTAQGVIEGGLDTVDPTGVASAEISKDVRDHIDDGHHSQQGIIDQGKDWAMGQVEKI